jgi:hypothetical protein
MELHLKIVGYIMILLAFIHFLFPKRFNWKTELGGLSLINRQLMYVHTFFVALMVLLMGVICIYSTTEILTTKLGRHLSFGLFLFWLTRLIFQFFVYSSELWKGKQFETIVHVAFSFLWVYFTVVFFLAFWR